MISKKFFISICLILISIPLYCDVIYLKKLDYQTMKIKKVEDKTIKNDILETLLDLGFFITDIKLHKNSNYEICATNYLKNKGTKINIKLKKKKVNEYLLRLNIDVKHDVLEHLDNTKKGGEQAYQNFFDALEHNLNNKEIEK